METKRWLKQIDEITDSFKKEFGNLSSEQLNWKSNATTWSIAQIIDHLIVINKTYLPIIEQVKQGTYNLIWLGKVKFLVNFFGKFILQSVEPTRKRKMKTFPIWEPTQSDIDSAILSRFEEHQNQLKEIINSCSTLLDNQIVISSPANRIIVYKLDTAFDIIVTHELRHLEQARELNSLRIKSV